MALLIVQLKRWQETGRERGGVTHGKGTQAGTRTRVHCSEEKASVRGTPALPTELNSTPRPQFLENRARTFDIFSKICGQTIAPDYHTAIFGVQPPGCKVSNLQASRGANAKAFAPLLACRLILFNWKSNSAPSFLQWLRDVLSCLPLEKLRYKIYKARQNFTLTWSPFIEFVEGFPFQWYILTLVVMDGHNCL